MQRVHSMGDVYPNSAKLPKGEYTLQLYLRYMQLHVTRYKILLHTR